MADLLGGIVEGLGDVVEDVGGAVGEFISAFHFGGLRHKLNPFRRRRREP